MFTSFPHHAEFCAIQYMVKHKISGLLNKKASALSLTDYVFLTIIHVVCVLHGVLYMRTVHENS